MADQAAKWQQEFKKAQGAATQVRMELQHWELLAGKSGAAGERARQGAQIRAKAMQLKLDLERLQRDLDSIGRQPAAQEATQKAVVQYREDLKQAVAELQDMQRRATSSAGTAASPASSRSWETISLGGSFSQLSNGDDRREAPAGAELQPVTQRQMLQQQQQRMRDMDEHASHLEGSVNNLQSVSNMILGEIRSQNTMLDNLNEDADRVQSRLGRARTMLARFSQTDRNRCVLCSIIGLLVALIVLFVYAVGT
mmetsp:Transcript_75666/g.225561  ORF Transcript_75666/g.225561 Transcript_75666/m.225561 type:complete len:254 (-) Transcript_75666:130-891(-)